MRRKLMLKFKSRNALKQIAFFLVIPVLTLIAQPGYAQDKVEVSGTVTEAISGEPLPGVSVLIKGTTAGTITNVDGKYTINALPTDVLVFSFIGYLNEEIPVGSNTVIDAALAQDIIGLDEVVVTGYGVQKKSDVTGSIASVSNEQLTAVPVAGVDQALQGRAAGVNIISENGRPGSSSTIQIRGITSINGVEPLIILDGAVYRNTDILGDLNPSDIESIEVLKDASSAAIYGASGGNGVIIITTKSGQSGKMVTTFNMYAGIERPVGKIDMMNSQQWLETVEENTPSDTAITSRPDTFPTYDWQDIVFDPAITENYDISFRGGSETSTFLVSSSYNKQEGIIRSSNFDRFTLRVNSEHKLTKRLTFDEKIYFVNTKNLGFRPGQWNEYYDGPIRPAIIMSPAIPDYLPNGDWANAEDFGLNVTGSNPLANLDMIDRTQRFNQIEANVGVKLEIIKGLTFTSRFAGRMGFTEVKEYQDDFWNTTLNRRAPDQVKLLASIDKDLTYNAQQYLTYNFTLADAFNFSLLAGIEASQDWGFDYQGERNRMPSDDEELLYFALAQDDTSSNQVIQGSGYKERRSAYFGRINADYKGKYLVTANIRRDGYSGFGPANRFGVFPSFSFGWKFSEEEFMKNQSFISFAKLRYGYGESGSYARSGSPYLSLVRSPLSFGYPYNNQTNSSGAAPVQIANPEIHWETVITQNLGIDLAFFANKFNLTAEYYSKVNDGMLMQKEVAYEAGTYQMPEQAEGDVTNPEVNIGSIKNSGFEFTMGYKKMEGDLKGSFDLNFSTVKNEVLELASDSLQGNGIHNISPLNLTRVGDPVSQFWGWEIDGMYTLDDVQRDANNEPIRDLIGRFSIPYTLKANGDTLFAPQNAQPGDMIFRDMNENGVVLETEDKVILGSPLPKLVFGFSLNLEYKGFDFSAFFNGTLGNKIFNGTKQYTYYYQGTTNHHADFANRYVVEDIVKIDPITYQEVVVVPENRNTDIYRNSAANYARPTSFYIEDGSYLRLRSVTLGYTIPKTLTERINVEKLRVYVGGKNLVTLTKYTGINPEAGANTNPLSMGLDVGVYPVTSMILFGVNLSF